MYNFLCVCYASISRFKNFQCFTTKGIFILEFSGKKDYNDSQPTYSCDFVRTSIAVINTMTRSSPGSKGLPLTTLRSHLTTEGSQGRNPEAGPRLKPRRENCLLACFSWLAQPSSYTNHNHLPSGPMPLFLWRTGPSHINYYQENATQTCPQAI